MRLRLIISLAPIMSAKAGTMHRTLSSIDVVDHQLTAARSGHGDNSHPSVRAWAAARKASPTPRASARAVYQLQGRLYRYGIVSAWCRPHNPHVICPLYANWYITVTARTAFLHVIWTGVIRARLLNVFMRSLIYMTSITHRYLISYTILNKPVGRLS